MKVIRGKKFILRPLKMGDAQSITENANDKMVSRGMGHMPYPYKLKDAEGFLAEVMKDYKRKKPDHFRLAIEIDGKAVGVIGLHVWQKRESHRAEIGYWIGKKYWGKGIVSEAVGKVVKCGFDNLKFFRIYAHVVPFNKASMKVLKKNKFKFEGILKKNAKKDNKFIDHCLFAKVK
ncbi:MAG: GNAT family N-acetyltransferase [Parcubacteria group bacterium]|jgi:RimJ/RimL family protein N-acetyltransferase